MILISTIYDIAKLANVSPATVSKVINNYTDVSEKTRAKVKRILKEQDFQPTFQAQCLSTKKSWTLGMVYSEDSNIGLKHPFFSSVIQSFKTEAEKNGFSLLFGCKNDRLNINTFLQYFKHKSVDGIAIICSRSDDKEVQEIINSSFPTVVIDMLSNKTSSVVSDNKQGCKLAIQYLYDMGHRRIAHITGMSEKSIHWISNIRKDSYINEMKNLKLPIKKGYIQYGNNFDFESGYKSMNNLLQLKEIPTAVFTAGDKLALGAIECIKDSGLNVPDDISVIGFDDIELCKYVTPKLTTVKQSCDNIGITAAQLLIDQINKKEKINKQKIIPVDLIIRDSCKKINE